MKHIKGNPKLKRYLRIRGLSYWDKLLIEARDELIESQAKMIDCQNKRIKSLEAFLSSSELLISNQKGSINYLAHELDIAKRFADCFAEKYEALRESKKLDEKLALIETQRKSSAKFWSGSYVIPVLREWTCWKINQIYGDKTYKKSQLIEKLTSSVEAKTTDGYIDQSQCHKIIRQLEVRVGHDYFEKLFFDYLSLLESNQKAQVAGQ